MSFKCLANNLNLYDDNDLLIIFNSPKVVRKCGGRRVHSVQNGLIKKAFVWQWANWNAGKLPLFLLLMKQNIAAPAFPSFSIWIRPLNLRFLTKFHLSKFYFFQADRPEELFDLTYYTVNLHTTSWSEYSWIWES